MQQPPSKETILAELDEICERMQQDPQVPKNLTGEELDQWLLKQIQQRRSELSSPEAKRPKRA